MKSEFPDNPMARGSGFGQANGYSPPFEGRIPCKTWESPRIEGTFRGLAAFNRWDRRYLSSALVLVGNRAFHNSRMEV